MNAIHLCCGAGGITLGFEQVGIKTAYAFDVNQVAVETHRENFPDAPCEVRDIRAIHAGDLPQADIWTCGIPCEPFSISGNMLGHDDERDLSFEIVRLLSESREMDRMPRFVFLENVPPYATTVGVAAIKAQLVGFAIIEAIFCHADYGAPTTRRRWHLIASQKSPAPCPKQTHTKNPDLFGHLPWIRFGHIRERNVEKYATSHTLNMWLRRIVKRSSAARGGFLPTIYDDNDVAPTMLTSTYKSFGQKQMALVYDDGRLRGFTELEARRAQGFPDCYIFCGNQEQRWAQIGRAVPPPFAAAMARAILESA